MKINYEAIAEKYKVDIESAKTKVDEILTAIKKVAPDETDEFYEEVLDIKLKEGAFPKPASSGKSAVEYAEEKGADVFKAVVLGISTVHDGNRITKAVARKEYKTNKNDAVTNKLVEVDDEGRITVLDSKKYFDKEQTKKNPNYGKPLPYVPEREMLVAMDGELYLARGDVSIWKKVVDEKTGAVSYKEPTVIAKTGMKSKLWGKLSVASDKPYKGVIRVWKDMYNDDEGEYPETWKIADKLLPESQYFVGLDEIYELPSYGMFVTHGKVINTEENEKGTAAIFLTEKGEDATARGVKFSCNYDGVTGAIKQVVQGDEVYVVFERSSWKSDTGYKSFNSLMGVIRNPGKNNTSTVLGKLKEMGI